MHEEGSADVRQGPTPRTCCSVAPQPLELWYDKLLLQASSEETDETDASEL